MPNQTYKKFIIVCKYQNIKQIILIIIINGQYWGFIS